MAGRTVLAGAALFTLFGPAVLLWLRPPWSTVMEAAGTREGDRPEDLFDDFCDVPGAQTPEQQEESARSLARRLASTADLKRLFALATGAAGYSGLIFSYRSSEDLGGFLNGTAFPVAQLLLTIVFFYGSPEIIDCRSGSPGRYTTAKARIAIRHHTIQRVKQARFERQLRDDRDQAINKEADEGEGH